MDKYSDFTTIIDSFRFYIMLGIQISNSNPELGNRLAKNFKKELLNNNYKREHINQCIHQASISLPSDFNYLHNLPNVSFKEI